MMHYREPAPLDCGVQQSSPCRNSTPKKSLYYDPGDPDDVDTGMRNIVYENDRVRNDLLDEICKDIGIKDSMDLDFIDLNPKIVPPGTNNNGVSGHKEDDLDEIIPFGVNDCHDDHYKTPVRHKILHKSSHEYSPYARTSCQQTSTGPAMPTPLTVQQQFMQKLICDESPAFRSHPLFPLLRDLVLADMNFSLPSFPRQLIANLPADFERLLRNFVMRNRTSESSGNSSVDNVLMDALRYAHQSLITKIQKVRSQQIPPVQPPAALPILQGPTTPQNGPMPSQQTLPVPQMPPQHPPLDPAPPSQCQIAAASPISPCHGGLPPTHYGENYPPPPQPGPPMHPIPPPPGNPGSPSIHHPISGSPLHMPPMPGSPMHRNPRACYTESPYNMYGGIEYSMNSELQPKQPGKKAVLPKESVAIMLDWLREHQDNPYPNDDEKEMLIQKTKLTINQINYWFTNARRRILPKWNSQKKEQELKEEKTEKKPISC